MSTHATSLDVAGLRAGFPSLREGRIYMDNPGGTQVHGSVMTAVTEYYLQSNANLGGPFETSVASDAVLEGARHDLARFLGCDPGEVIFGANMTTLTLHASRATRSWSLALTTTATFRRGCWPPRTAARRCASSTPTSIPA